MGVLERLRSLSSEQRRALQVIDEQEQRAAEIEALEEEHLSTEEAYLRRRDRLLGREVAEVYSDIEAARSALRREAGEQRKRFERMRMAVLSGHLGRTPGDAQLELLPAHPE